LIEWVSETGRRLQGSLVYPANHDPSRRYPMIVYTYEILSSGIHTYEVPSERDYYNFTAWTQNGYFVLLPDIVYRWRDPGVSAIESVRPAVAKTV
jgi:dipeptidyl aminopeptidase/acylaminoacyl peptidase